MDMAARAAIVLGTIEPDLLRSFVAIAETGSFTAAAGRVARTQSAVSMQMKRLEEGLQRPLFERTGRSVGLTYDGERLLWHARRILRVHQEALAAFDDDALTGTVTLGTPDDYASALLPGILARFGESHPRVHVDLVCDSTRSLRERLAAGSVDLALLVPPVGTSRGVVVHRERAVWVTSAQHDAQDRVPLPLALYHPGCPFRRWALDTLSTQGRAHRIAYTSVSFAGNLAAVRSGLAVGVVAESSLYPGLRRLSEDEGFPALPMFEVSLERSRERPSRLLDRLESHIAESFRGIVPLAA